MVQLGKLNVSRVPGQAWEVHLPATAIAAEPVIRLACFLGILMAMALWEVLAPRRPQAVRRPLRWPNNWAL